MLTITQQVSYYHARRKGLSNLLTVLSVSVKPFSSRTGLLKRFLLLVHNLVTLSLHWITIYYLKWDVSNQLLRTFVFQATSESTLSSLLPSSKQKSTWRKTYLGDGYIEHAFHLPSQALCLLSLYLAGPPGPYTPNISLFSLWELLSLNHCAALPPGSMKDPFKNLLKVIALVSEDVSLHSTWCPIYSLQSLTWDNFSGKNFSCTKELVSFLLSNSKNSVIACLTFFNKEAQNQISS